MRRTFAVLALSLSLALALVPYTSIAVDMHGPPGPDIAASQTTNDSDTAVTFDADIGLVPGIVYVHNAVVILERAHAGPPTTSIESNYSERPESDVVLYLIERKEQVAASAHRALYAGSVGLSAGLNGNEYLGIDLRRQQRKLMGVRVT